jgi:hypothetical protein
VKVSYCRTLSPLTVRKRCRHRVGRSESSTKMIVLVRAPTADFYAVGPGGGYHPRPWRLRSEPAKVHSAEIPLRSASIPRRYALRAGATPSVPASHSERAMLHTGEVHRHCSRSPGGYPETNLPRTVTVTVESSPAEDPSRDRQANGVLTRHLRSLARRRSVGKAAPLLDRDGPAPAPHWANPQLRVGRRCFPYGTVKVRIAATPPHFA